jgi:hypothetical protein
VQWVLGVMSGGLWGRGGGVVKLFQALSSLYRNLGGGGEAVWVHD